VTRDCPEGATLVDVVVAMAITAILGGLSVPLVSQAMDAGRIRQAAGLVASRFRLARAQAASATRVVSVVFDHVDGRWVFAVCEDRNGNGVRRAEIQSGTDVCVDGPYDLAALFPGVQVAADAAVRGPDGESGSADPVRFGSANLASFAPAGTCSAGSLWLRSAGGSQLMVRVAGVTGRVRVLRYDAASGQWRDG
jgi:type II secretory pathway pseudopilin PulG